ncbi:hypothetical protein [Stappia sp.]|uniref:hypothetical protein n=1 Tax=Stappia sp. TaxID=1870903 RepID=UPI003A9A4BCC
MNGHGNGRANAAAGGGMTAERAMQRGQGAQAGGGMRAGNPAGTGINGGVGLAVSAYPGGATQAMPPRSRWGRIWPWALLWGAAPMPLYIWLVVGMMV